MKSKLYIILLFLVTTSFFAQQKRVTTSIDTTKNKIGSEFKLTLKTKVDTLSRVVFPKAKFFGKLEVIESYKIDTIKDNDRYELIKKYGLTQFDSGIYTIPRLQVVINGKINFSDSIKIEIQNVVVDTLKQKMYDIKDISKVERPIGAWWIYLLILLLMAGSGLYIYKLIQKKKNNEKPEEIVFKTPIEKATTLLQQLEKKELWQQGEVKSYYSELTDIARNYIEEEMQIPAMESTTSELIESLRNVAKQKKIKLSQETIENLEKVLKQADLVKFAKSKPLDFEIEEDKKRISNSIVVIHKSIPVEVEVTDELEQWNEQQKELARLHKIKQEKRKRVIRIISGFFGGLFLILTVLIYIKGFDFVKDILLGNPNKELVEGKWIYSEYGNPGIKIETPKVLIRKDAAQFLSKNTAALIKSMQLFDFGNMLDDYYLLVSTSQFKQETQVDLDKAIEEFLKVMETKGAQNIIVKTEEFNTQHGISGRKAYGTLTVLDSSMRVSEKMYYELLVFAQNGGLQQILLMHRERDDYGSQISERILNSVELKKVQE